MPVIRNLTACSSVQPGRPAMFGALSAQTGIGVIGLNERTAPRSVLPGIASPFSLRGVWQSPHMPTPSTRYLPRATFAERAGDAEEDNAAVITRIDKMATAAAQAASFMRKFLQSFVWNQRER